MASIMLQVVQSPHNLVFMGSIRSVVACLSLAAVARKMTAATGQSVSGTSAAAAGLLRLTSVPGYDHNRVNDVLLLRPAAETQRRCDNETQNLQDGNDHVVFFPGDIQVGACYNNHRPPFTKAIWYTYEWTNVSYISIFSFSSQTIKNRPRTWQKHAEKLCLVLAQRCQCHAVSVYFWRVMLKLPCLHYI